MTDKLDRAEIVRRIREGISINALAKELGVSRKAIMYHLDRAGVRSTHDQRKTYYVDIRGEHLSLPEVSRRYGIPRGTILYRYHRGDRGERLIRKPRSVHNHSRVPPPVYRLGKSEAEWREYADLARRKGASAVKMATGIPTGAINAAVRGEFHRLD